MQEAALLPLATWQTFYVLVGTAAATLTGLMFVVITVNAGVRNRRTSDGIGAFGTPNVFHFEAALLVAAILSAPWSMLWMVALLLGLSGVGGVAYISIVLRRFLRVRRQSHYTPVLEDWLWYILFPLVSYIAFIVAALMLPANAAPALFIIAAAGVLLLFIGIHNAWDLVLFTAFELLQPENKSQD
jgi:hypothetical protein